MPARDRALTMLVCLIPFFKTGPLAWNGILSFWIPVAVFVAWFVVMLWAMRVAILRTPQAAGVRTVAAS